MEKHLIVTLYIVNIVLGSNVTVNTRIWNHMLSLVKTVSIPFPVFKWLPGYNASEYFFAVFVLCLILYESLQILQATMRATYARPLYWKYDRYWKCWEVAGTDAAIVLLFDFFYCPTNDYPERAPLKPVMIFSLSLSLLSHLRCNHVNGCRFSNLTFTLNYYSRDN